MLLLVARDDGPWFRPEAPDGRLQIVGARLRPVIEGPIADEVAGQSADDVKRLVQDAV